MVALLKYTVLRLALFAAALWLLLLAGAGPVIALVGGALVSLLLSYVLLRGPREQLSVEIAERVDHRHAKGPSAAEQDAALEDAADDALRSGAATPPATTPEPAGEPTGTARSEA